MSANVTPPGESRVPGLRHLVVLALLGLLMAGMGLEIVARLYLRYLASDERFLSYASLEQLRDRYPQSLYTPHRYLGYLPTPNYRNGANRHNSLGYRGDDIAVPKPSGRFRIVFIGGSTVYETAIDDYRLASPYLLEAELRSRGYPDVEVVNAGVGSWSTWESLVSLQFRDLDLDPDLIIIYHAINDIPPRLVWPPTAYRGDNSGRRAPNTGVFTPGLLEHSTALRVLMIKLGLTESQAKLERTIDRSPPTFFDEEFENQKMAGVYPQGIFRRVSAAEMLRVNQPVYFRRNLENMVVIAEHRHIQTVLATFAYTSYRQTDPRVTSPEYIEAFDELNATIRSVAQQRGVDLFDFAEVFPKDARYYVDGRHVNVEGSRLKAKLFADHLFASGLLVRSTRK
jgi:hypothetical protein